MTFKVGVENLEDKIYRIIDISDEMTLADLAYTILASFDSLAYHLYNIKHNSDIYDCAVIQDETTYELHDATKTLLKDIDFSNPKMIMEYDFGSTNTFIITYLNKSEESIKEPSIKEGKGTGIIDDISSYDLLEVVENIDKDNNYEYYYTAGYEKEEPYDYKIYDINEDNKTLISKFKKIKSGYEEND